MLEWLLGPAEQETGTGTPPRQHFADGDDTDRPRVQASAFATAGNNFSALNAGTPDNFEVFLKEYGPVLEEYCKLRDETLCLRFLATNEGLLMGVMYSRWWYFMRHVNSCRPYAGSTDALAPILATVKEEASGFFLLDLAADAAQSHHRTHPDAELTLSSLKGLWMLAADLSSPADPVKLRQRIGERVRAWTDLVRQRVEKAGSPKRGGHGSAAAAAADSRTPRTARDARTPRSARGSPLPKSQLNKRKPPSDPARALRPLGFEVIGPIAAGNFSTILRCRIVESGLEVAVKSFDAAKCAKDATLGTCRDNELEVLRLLRETARRDDKADGVGHPHIASMLEELGDADASHQHAVLQYCDGGTLKRHLQNLTKGSPTGLNGLESSGMPPFLVAKATGQLASALAHLHALGVAHGDMKPANVLLCHPLPTPSPADADAQQQQQQQPVSKFAAAQPQTQPQPPRIHLKLCDFGFASAASRSSARSAARPPTSPPRSSRPPTRIGATSVGQLTSGHSAASSMRCCIAGWRSRRSRHSSWRRACASATTSRSKSRRPMRRALW
jgi:hypothetical protein